MYAICYTVANIVYYAPVLSSSILKQNLKLLISHSEDKMRGDELMRAITTLAYTTLTSYKILLLRLPHR